MSSSYVTEIRTFPFCSYHSINVTRITNNVITVIGLHSECEAHSQLHPSVRLTHIYISKLFAKRILPSCMQVLHYYTGIYHI